MSRLPCLCSVGSSLFQEMIEVWYTARRPAYCTYSPYAPRFLWCSLSLVCLIINWIINVTKGYIILSLPVIYLGDLSLPRYITESYILKKLTISQFPLRIWTQPSCFSTVLCLSVFVKIPWLRAVTLQTGDCLHQETLLIHTVLRNVRPEDTQRYKHTSCVMLRFVKCTVSNIKGKYRDVRWKDKCRGFYRNTYTVYLPTK